jgi:hypothetical protein
MERRLLAQSPGGIGSHGELRCVCPRDNIRKSILFRFYLIYYGDIK